MTAAPAETATKHLIPVPRHVGRPIVAMMVAAVPVVNAVGRLIAKAAFVWRAAARAKNAAMMDAATTVVNAPGSRRFVSTINAASIA
jgi:hypothetical protein